MDLTLQRKARKDGVEMGTLGGHKSFHMRTRRKAKRPSVGIKWSSHDWLLPVYHADTILILAYCCDGWWLTRSAEGCRWLVRYVWRWLRPVSSADGCHSPPPLRLTRPRVHQAPQYATGYHRSAHDLSSLDQEATQGNMHDDMAYNPLAR
jgi:hypothetical protein